LTNLAYCNIISIIYISFEWKQVGLKTGSKRAADGGIAAAMLKLNGSRRILGEH